MSDPNFEPKRHTAAGNGVVRTDPKGDLVLYIDYARLLSEVKELKSQPDPLTAYLYAAELAKDDINRLKAEVERLTLLQVETLAERNKAEAEIERLTAFTTRTIIPNEELQAQVERLTKAGDAMAEEIALAKRQDEGSRFDPIEMHYDHELIVKWNAAKEGNKSNG